MMSPVRMEPDPEGGPGCFTTIAFVLFVLLIAFVLWVWSVRP